ncbi:MAG TPA: M20/M25/M40 family metallo-hydrolase [Pyrinomonadaceae bacterium]|jgi:Zn-dependent M28 family amino/carboxypeptidase|nr:M20/M25/M40 family metallo-hydrolase [Pyrinomonadaceae bacterium]
MKQRSIIRRALALVAASGVFASAALGQGGAPPRETARPAAPRSEVIDAARLLRDVEALSSDDMRGRKTGTEGGAKARAYVVAAYKKYKLKPFGASYLQPFTFERGGKSYAGSNVVGYVEGKSKAARRLVVSAHYDHVGVVRGDIYNGADDNASGVAALLAMAEYFGRHRPAHSIVFVAFDAEELGLQGSQWFVKSPPVDLKTVVAEVNMDMVSHNDRNELYAAGASRYPFLKPYLDRVAAAAPVRLLAGHDDPKLGKDDWTPLSDQAAFHRAGVPFVYFGVEDHKDYHQPTDDFANINRDFFVRATETILSAVRLLDENLDAISASAAAPKK